MGPCLPSATAEALRPRGWEGGAGGLGPALGARTVLGQGGKAGIPPGTLLVGDNVQHTASGAFFNPQKAAYRQFTASNTATLAHSYVLISTTNSEGGNIKFVIWASDKTVLAVSNPVTVSLHTDPYLQDFTWSSPPTITSGNTYYLGIIPDASSYPYLYHDGSSSGPSYDDNNYTTPISLPGTPGDAGEGVITIYVTN